MGSGLDVQETAATPPDDIAPPPPALSDPRSTSSGGPGHVLGALALAIGPPFADTVLAFARGWDPTRPSDRTVAAAIVGIAMTVASFASVPAGRRLLAERGAAWAIRCLAVAVSLFVVELLLAGPFHRVVMDATLFHRRAPGISLVFHPDPDTVPGVSGPTRYTTGAEGLRGSAWGAAQPPRVLCVGGSTTDCQDLDDEETWTRLVERDPRVARTGARVFAAGMPGARAAHHAEFIAHASLAREADAIVVLCGVNDVRARAGGVLADAQTEPMWARSRIARILHDLLARAGPGGAWRMDDPSGMRYAAARASRAARPAEPLPGPAGTETYERELRRIVSACRDRRQTLVFVRQPILWAEPGGAQPYATLCGFGATASGGTVPLGELRRALDELNDAMTRVAAAEGVVCVDPCTMSGSSRYFFDDCHFSEEGARELARIIAPALAAALTH